MSFDFPAFLKGCIGPFGKFALLSVEEDVSDPDICDLYVAHVPDTPEPGETGERKMPCFAAWDPDKRVMQIIAMIAPEALGLESEDEALLFANDINACVNRLYSLSLITPQMLSPGKTPDEDEIGSLRFALSIPVPPLFDDAGSWRLLRAMVHQALRALLIEGSGYLALAEENAESTTDPSRYN